MAQRKRNPSVGTLLLVAGVIGVAAWGVSTIGKKTTKKSVSSGGSSSSGGTPAPGKYVGTGWKNWPHKDFFLDESYFGETLELLGYPTGKDPRSPGWTALDPRVKASVKYFQEDWNTVVKYAKDLLQKYAGGPYTRFVSLTVDGKIGRATTEALYETFIINEDVDWQAVVAQAIARKEQA